MQFKKAKEILAEKLKEYNIQTVKHLRKPSKGDFINRLAYQIATGKLKVVKKRNFGKTTPGKLIEEFNSVKLLMGKGSESPDAVIVKETSYIVEKVLSPQELKFPHIAIDMSFFNLLKGREISRLLNQIELTYGTVKDYFTPENFFILDKEMKSLSALESFFHPEIPFNIKTEIPENLEIIVLDPHGAKTLEKGEIDADTVLVLGGIVDHGERLTGATREILKNVPHRKITYKGEITAVSDRINELAKILCDFLTLPIIIDEAVKRNLTRQGKLKIVKEKLQKNTLKVNTEKGKERILPLSIYLSLKKEFNLADFHFPKEQNIFTDLKLLKTP